jgi:hypothetical protein
MVEVRKPGRPLSTCAHPPGRRCQCGGITAAIPKRNNCACPSHSSPSTPIKHEDEVPMSPTSKANFRVDRSASKTSSSKQFYPSALLRMDAGSVNVMGSFGPNTFYPPYDSATSTPVPAYPNGYPTEAGYQTGIQYPMAGGPTNLPAGLEMGARPAVNSAYLGQDSLVESSVSSTNETSRTSSCCSGASSVPHHTPTSSSGSVMGEVVEAPKAASSCCAPRVEPRIEVPKARSSCCGPRIETAENQPQPFPGIVPQVPPSNGYPQPLGYSQQQFFSAFSQQTAYMPPAPTPFGSYTHPLRPEEYERMVALSHQPPQVQQAYSFSQPILPEQNGQNGFVTGNMAHDCHCGPGCECLGCLEHPYNSNTTNTMKSLYELQDENHSAPSDGFDSIANSISAHSAVEGDSPLAAHTPNSDTHSNGFSTREEQMLSADNYYWVNYPIGCEGEEESCGCGDDCQCIGCQIHGNVEPAG